MPRREKGGPQSKFTECGIGPALKGLDASVRNRLHPLLSREVSHLTVQTADGGPEPWYSQVVSRTIRMRKSILEQSPSGDERPDKATGEQKRMLTYKRLPDFFRHVIPH